MSTVQAVPPPLPVAPERYSIRRIVTGSDAREQTGTVSEVSGGYVWFVYDGEAHATTYDLAYWSAMVAEGVAARVGGVVPPRLIPERIDDGDWREAFTYACGEGNVSAVLGWKGSTADVLREDVAEVIAADYGENDGANWIGVFRMRDGRIAFVSAGCDYSGWDCQANGHTMVCGDLDTMIRLGLGDKDRERLNLPLPA